MKTPTVINAFSMIAQADSIRRYSRDRVLVEESVMAHTGWCAMWCVFMGKQFERETNQTLNWGELLFKCAVHDLDEIGTGDIPRTTKYATPQVHRALDIVATGFVFMLERQLEVRPGDLSHPWMHAKHPTLEGWMIKYADIAAVAYKVWDEITRGSNFGFFRVAFELRSALEDFPQPDGMFTVSVAAWFEELRLTLLQLVDDALHSCPASYKLGPIDLSLESNHDKAVDSVNLNN